MHREPALCEGNQDILRDVSMDLCMGCSQSMSSRATVLLALVVLDFTDCCWGAAAIFYIFMFLYFIYQFGGQLSGGHHGNWHCRWWGPLGLMWVLCGWWHTARNTNSQCQLHQGWMCPTDSIQLENKGKTGTRSDSCIYAHIYLCVRWVPRTGYQGVYMALGYYVDFIHSHVMPFYMARSAVTVSQSLGLVHFCCIRAGGTCTHTKSSVKTHQFQNEAAHVHNDS